MTAYVESAAGNVAPVVDDPTSTLVMRFGSGDCITHSVEYAVPGRVRAKMLTKAGYDDQRLRTVGRCGSCRSA